MSCVLADPIHASGGCIFADPFVIAPVPDGEVHPPGTSEDAEARYRRILVEDEMIMLVVQAWLSMKDR